MDLVVVSSNLDVIAVKTVFCSFCLEQKLNTKIIKVFWRVLDFNEFMKLKKDGLQGFNISCECNTKTENAN